MSALVKPKAASVENMLAMLFGVDGLDVSDSTAMPEGPAAVYVGDDGQLLALGVGDFAFAAYSGAALSMLPKGGAQDMVDEKSLSSTVEANFYEVMNICSRLLMNDQSVHLRLDRLVDWAEAKSLIESMGGHQSMGFSVPVPRYGSGQLAFVIAA
ncbi:hypothetical protein [Spongiibacter tropicus]|uniref:hypothetical protein n=1 Tax=Spongiibacter tropicus TaxID=454602 RepID=UPI003A98DDF8